MRGSQKKFIPQSNSLPWIALRLKIWRDFNLWVFLDVTTPGAVIFRERTISWQA